ncbi:hypothetical protein N8482_02085 [Chitinophagales bacterium]|nr:hypothetical protein [Chitinophagales bacterium]
MNQLQNRVSHLSAKIDQLLDDYQAVEEQNRTLKEKNRSLQTQLVERDKRVDLLENRVSWLKKQGGAPVEKGEEKEINQKINKYIREIDKCIALLSE